MLSYRHAFHAGNHADVLKHLAQVLILDYLIEKKDKPLSYIDTHAGPGVYSLEKGFSQQNTEYVGGITPIWNASDLPLSLQRYREVIAHFNPQGKMQWYPGSPAIAAHILRPIDRLNLFELHPQDEGFLQKWKARDRRIKIEQRDGFDGLISLLPPLEKRGMVVIDPPFEIKKDYQTVIKVLSDAMRRFATGTYLLWYPLLQRADVAQMMKKLEGQGWRYLHAQLHVCQPEGWGMYGSGLFVINPPWKLAQQIESCLPWLVDALGQDDSAGYQITSQGLD